MTTRIFIADDHQIIRQGLKSLLDLYPDFEVVGEAADGRNTVRLAERLAPDVIVMDIAMPELNGIEATRQLIKAHPEIKVIALSMHVDRRIANQMLRAGARAYLVKDGAFEELAEAIRAVIAGKSYISASLADESADATESDSAFDRLSPREREVLQLLAEGRSTKEIAMDLTLSVKTIETHRRQFMEKLNLFSVAELTKYAIREGLTSLEMH